MTDGLDAGAMVSPRAVRGIFPPATWTSHGLGWRSVLLDAFENVPAGDVSTPALDHHAVVVQTGAPLRMRQERSGSRDDRLLVTGDALIVSRGRAATWTFDRPLDVLYVFVPTWLLTAAARELGRGRAVDVEIVDSFHVETPALAAMSLLLLEELKQGVQPGQSLLVDSLAGAMAVQLLRNHGAFDLRDRVAAPLDDTRLRRVLAYIEEHLAGRLDLDTLAGIALVSRFQFPKMFKRAVGESPHRYVVGRRLDMAARLLSSSSLRIADVAAACGFADQSHMTRLFRSRYQTTPAAYRAGTATHPP
jgi:AraC family transcriptional regulator